MGRPNVFTDELERWDEESGFRGAMAVLGAAAGAQRLGATVYVLGPGETPFPYHFHRANEELLVVLEGRPSLRTPEGERELAEGSVVAFREGPAGGHQVINRSDQPTRYVMFSTKRLPEFIEYPDSGKVGVASLAQEGDGGPGTVRFLFKKDSAVGYFDGEQAPS